MCANILRFEGFIMSSRRSKYIVLGAMAIGAIGLNANSALADGWGSIAVNFPGEGVSMANPPYGIGGGSSKDEAIKNALKFCAESGGKAWQTVVSYEKCGAYAASTKAGGMGMASSKKEAEDLAIGACKDGSCKVVVSDCN